VRADPHGRGLILGSAGRPGEGALQLDRCVKAGMRAGERRQESVALRLEQFSVMVRNHLLDEGAVVLQQLFPALRPQPVREDARVGYVAQHQSDGPIGRADPSKIRYQGLERGGDYVDRGALSLRFHVQSVHRDRPMIP